MTDIANLVLKADSSQLVKAKRDLDNLAPSAKNAENAASGMGRSFDSSSRQVDKTSKSVSAFTSVTNGAIGSLRAYGTAFLAAFGAQQLIRTVDEYTKFNAQLKLATRSQEEYARALSDVNSISQATQTNISGIGTLYARINNAVRDLGVSQEGTARITENVGLALKVSGATASESASAILQLSQAFGSGVLRGEEFNAVNEAVPALMRALAESIGVPIGALREMASEGQLTSDVLVKAFGDEKLLNTFREQAKEVQTISGAFTNLTNRLTIVIGKINEATGASTALIKVLRGAEILLSAFEGGEKGSILRNFLDTGEKARQDLFKSMSTAELKEQAKFFADARKSLDERLKQQQSSRFSGISPAGNIAPNFNTTIEAQDIEKIHALQDEREKKRVEYANKARQDAEKMAEETRKDWLEEQIYEYETAKEYAEKERADWLKEQINQQKIIEDAEEEEYKRKTKITEMLQKQANENFEEAQKLFMEAEKERVREFEKTIDGINQTFREGFASLINGGKGSWKAFTQSLFTTFKTTVADQIYKLFAQPFVVKIIASLAGLLGGVGTANAGGILESVTGGNGLLGGIKDVFNSTNNSIVSSIENLGTFLSTGNGGLGDTIGGFLGQYSTKIADGFGYLGAAFQLAQGNIGGAIGTGLGTLLGGPVGGAIGSFIGGALGGLFGGGLPPRVTESRSGSFVNGQFNATEGLDKGKRKLGAASSLDELNRQFAQNLNTLFSGFGVENDIYSNSLLTKKKETRARFNATVNGQFLGYEELSFGKKGDFQTAFNALVDAALGSYTTKAIQASSLPEGIKKFFDGLTKKEDIADAINTLLTLNKALMDLPPIFNAVRNAIDTNAYQTSIEALKAQFSATQTFVSLFYSDAEKLDILFKQLGTQFGALGQDVPKTAMAYRQLVESINVVDEASRDQFNALIALAPAMDAYLKALEAQENVLSRLSPDRFRTFFDYIAANSFARAGLTIPAANMPSYDVGTSFVPNDGMAMLHQGEAVLTRADNQSMTSNMGQMVTLLNSVVNELSQLKYDMKRAADGSQRSARELEDITAGDVTILTKAA